MKALALSIAFTACMAGEAFSDYFLRGKLHATHANRLYGIDPHAWDVVCSVGTGVFGIALLIVCLSRSKPTPIELTIHQKQSGTTHGASWTRG